MRTGILEKSRDFIIKHTQKNVFVFRNSDVESSIKNYLVKEKMLYSPIRGIYVLKKSDAFASEVVEKYCFQILELIEWIHTGEFVLSYYLWEKLQKKYFKIITKNKNFQTQLWENKNIILDFQASLVPRETEKIEINGAKLEVEKPLSFAINNYFSLWENKKFQKFLLSLEISPEDIKEKITQNYKVSGLSKIALFYKNNWYNEKYKTIISELKSAWKRVDNRNIKSEKKVIVKQKNTSKKIDLNDLF